MPAVFGDGFEGSESVLDLVLTSVCLRCVATLRLSPRRKRKGPPVVVAVGLFLLVESIGYSVSPK